jgi:hypothetical protein
MGRLRDFVAEAAGHEGPDRVESGGTAQFVGTRPEAGITDAEMVAPKPPFVHRLFAKYCILHLTCRTPTSSTSYTSVL